MNEINDYVLALDLFIDGIIISSLEELQQSFSFRETSSCRGKSWDAFGKINSLFLSSGGVLAPFVALKVLKSMSSLIELDLWACSSAHPEKLLALISGAESR